MNWCKHHVHYEEAFTIFEDPFIAVIDDPDHSVVENRYVAVGQTNQGRLVVVTYTIRNDEPWLITAREAEPRERRRHMSGKVRDGDEMRPYYDFSNGVRGKHYQGRM